MFVLPYSHTEKSPGSGWQPPGLSVLASVRRRLSVCLLTCWLLFAQGFLWQPWPSWNLLFRPSWPWIHQDSPAGIKSICHHGQLLHLFLVNLFYMCDVLEQVACLVPQEARRRCWETRITVICELTCGCWEFSPGLLDEQSVLNHWALSRGSHTSLGNMLIIMLEFSFITAQFCLYL